MGKIKIISDRDGVYQESSIVDVVDFIADYVDCCVDETIKSWIVGIPIPCAIDFIAHAWGIEYEFV